ncbi:MAG: acyl-ACP--UDP-N-acetylglucosamine O-acyltransferase [Saprospiraceae bacterium]|nr:acyl-ACP--UDP-N-acetylglucosamine O-acyltransferase [Saprospiraceae bacterium]
MNLQLNEISKKAKIGKNVHIGSFTTVSDDVEIGDGTWIGPNVVIMNGVKIGNNCKIFPGAILGAIPQDLKFDGEESLLEIGNNVVVREYCTLNRGTKANNKTRIMDNVLLMAYVHVAHDCIIHHNAILANNVNLAGHVEIGKYSILGGLVAVHQFVNIGDHCMVGGGSLVRKDIPPFVKAAREPLSYVGVNSVGLRRRGYSNKQINHIQDIYRILYVHGNNTTQALSLIEATIKASPEREAIIGFIQSADRGIMRGFRQNS